MIVTVCASHGARPAGLCARHRGAIPAAGGGHKQCLATAPQDPSAHSRRTNTRGTALPVRGTRLLLFRSSPPYPAVLHRRERPWKALALRPPRPRRMERRARRRGRWQQSSRPLMQCKVEISKPVPSRARPGMQSWFELGRRHLAQRRCPRSSTSSRSSQTPTAAQTTPAPRDAARPRRVSLLRGCVRGIAGC